jgi:hypothetical protein
MSKKKLACIYKKCTGLSMATKSYTSFSHFLVLMFSCKCTLTKKALVFLYICKLTNLNIKNMLKVKISYSSCLKRKKNSLVLLLSRNQMHFYLEKSVCTDLKIEYTTKCSLSSSKHKLHELQH